MNVHSNAELDGLIADLYGSDPVAGNAALESLVLLPTATVTRVLPKDTILPADPRHSGLTLRRLIRRWGIESAEYLVTLIKTKSPNRALAAECFRFMPYDGHVSSTLAKLLDAKDFEVERAAIDGLGYYSASGWDFRLIEKATANDYEAAKLGDYVMGALLRMVLRASESEVASRLRALTRFVKELRTTGEFTNIYNGMRFEHAIADWPTTAADGDAARVRFASA